MRGVYEFTIGNRKCEVFVWNHCPTHWGASATDNGAIGKAIHLKKVRYRTEEEVAKRAIEHFREQPL